VDRQSVTYYTRLGGKVGHFLIGIDEFRPAVGVAGIIHRIHTDENVAAANSAELKTIELDLRTIGGSALTDDIDVPEEESEGIPVTYVPARNTIMLSLALAWAEVLGADDIFIGVNAVDYSGYPDCRPEFINAYEEMANLATKAGVIGHRLTIHTPLIDLSKADIIRQGITLGVDYSITVSCYQADEEGRACGVCDSCRIRAAGFDAAHVSDPTQYISS
jgi:7-cyano-7-deazaguanine synthase